MILILNHQIKNCGVYQFGKRVSDLILQSDLQIQYEELNSPNEYNKLISKLNPKIILFNWYPITMGWLSNKFLNSEIKNYFIFHDGHIRNIYDKYIFFGEFEKEDSIRIPNDKKYLLPRPLLNYTGDYPKNNIPNIGSFGFGFWHKGFPELVKKINEEFDEAVINLHIPNAHFGDSNGVTAREVIRKCIEVNKNPRIILSISSDLKSDNELLEFLARNDINVFMYNAVNEGLSSVIDYALSVKRPIAITDNMMFRHIKKDKILVEKNSLLDIMSRGIEPLLEFYDKWSTQNFIKESEKVFG